MTAHAFGDDAALRLAALGLADGTDWSRCSDHEVADAVDAALASGRLPLGDRAAVLPTMYPLIAPRVAATAAPAASASAPRMAPVAPPALPEATFGADLDVAAMVAALRQAAQDGVPFCEECARAAAARAAGGVAA